MGLEVTAVPFITCSALASVFTPFASGFSFFAQRFQKNWLSVYLPFAPYVCTAAFFYLVLSSILQDFHKTQSGILFGSVVLLKTFWPYFCKSCCFGKRTLGAWFLDSPSKEGCTSHINWPFLLFNLEVSNVSEFLSF